MTHPKMRRRMENPRIILLDCPLEYKKAESGACDLLSRKPCTTFSGIVVVYLATALLSWFIFPHASLCALSAATNLEITKEEDFEAILRQEEEFISKVRASRKYGSSAFGSNLALRPERSRIVFHASKVFSSLLCRRCARTSSRSSPTWSSPRRASATWRPTSSSRRASRRCAA